jgi:two-component system response regulator NreC
MRDDEIVRIVRVVRALLVDDHAIVREGLRAILERAGTEVVGECSNGREALPLARRLLPDVVLMEISMPELNGIDATRRVLDELPQIKVIGLSMHADERHIAELFSAGASGYLPTDSASRELLAAIQAVVQNQTYLSPAVAWVALSTLAPGAPKHHPRALTGREREVLQLLAEGHTSKEICARLSIAVPTVETHRRQIMSKLGIRTIAELTKFAIRQGLTPLGP